MSQLRCGLALEQLHEALERARAGVRLGHLRLVLLPDLDLLAHDLAAAAELFSFQLALAECS